MKLSPLQRFEELIAAPNFQEYLRSEPITFEGRDQNYGYLCDIPDCEHSSSGHVFCESHRQERVAAEQNGISEPEWRKQVRPRISPGRIDTSLGGIALAGLPPLVAAEIRYALFANVTSPRPTKWNPRWLRALIQGLEESVSRRSWKSTPGDAHVGREKEGLETLAAVQRGLRHDHRPDAGLLLACARNPF